MPRVLTRVLGNRAGANKGIVNVSLGPLHSANLTTNGLTAFIADQAYRVIDVREVHTVAGTDVGAVTAQLKKCTGTQTPAAGTAVTTDTFNLKSAINTPVVGTLSTTDSDLELAVGDRLCLNLVGVFTAFEGGTVRVQLLPLPDASYRRSLS